MSPSSAPAKRSSAAIIPTRRTSTSRRKQWSRLFATRIWSRRRSTPSSIPWRRPSSWASTMPTSGRSITPGRRASRSCAFITGGATGGSAFHGGWLNIASGQARTCLVIGADRVAETPDAQHILNLIWDRFYEHDFALNTVTMIALMTQRYMAMRGLTEEQAARVVVRSRRNAINNPYAHLKGQITVDDVMNSRPVSTPYKLFDICLRSSGACAVVLACEDVARKKCAQPPFVHGI